MFTPTQIELIRLIGSKELSFGLLINTINKGIYRIDTHDMVSDGEIWRERNNAEPYMVSNEFEILGHLPTLEDLFIKAEEKDWIIFIDEKGICIRKWKTENKNINIPYNPKLKPYQQTEETMQEILNLFK